MDLTDEKMKFFGLMSQAKSSAETAKLKLDQIWEDSQIRLRTDEITQVVETLREMAVFEKKLQETVQKFFHITSEEVDNYLKEKESHKKK